MGDGQIHRIDSLQEDALVLIASQMYPAVFKLSRIVPGQRGGWHSVDVVQQEARLDQDLKAIADTKNQLLRSFELVKRVLQMVADLIGQDSARSNVVAIGKTARKTENLKLLRKTRVFQIGRASCRERV